MAAMTGYALLFSYRLMLNPVTAHLGFNLRRASETNLSRLAFDEMVLVRAMRAMTGQTIALGKRRMGGLLKPFPDQLVVTGQAELTLIK
jgi:hypothetical protein